MLSFSNHEYNEKANKIKKQGIPARVIPTKNIY